MTNGILGIEFYLVCNLTQLPCCLAPLFSSKPNHWVNKSKEVLTDGCINAVSIRAILGDGAERFQHVGNLKTGRMLTIILSDGSQNSWLQLQPRSSETAAQLVCAFTGDKVVIQVIETQDQVSQGETKKDGRSCACHQVPRTPLAKFLP